MLTREKLIEIIEDAGVELCSEYSGRGMMGRTCVGAVTDEPILKVLASMIDCIDDPADVGELLRRAQTDSMGRGTIIYWPSIKATVRAGS